MIIQRESENFLYFTGIAPDKLNENFPYILTDVSIC